MSNNDVKHHDQHENQNAIVLIVQVIVQQSSVLWHSSDVSEVKYSKTIGKFEK